jgi:hypothetical protein
MTATQSPLFTATRQAADYLLAGQNPDGSWSDFWLPVGTSDAWVTAYVGLSLCEAVEQLPPRLKQDAHLALKKAGNWLLAGNTYRWGYNSSVPPDADSSAHAVSFLSRSGYRIPKEALQFLQGHKLEHKGYRTYTFRHQQHRWNKATPEITAAVLRALYDAGELSREGLAERWQAYLPLQQGLACWESYWWLEPYYTTGLALEVWALAGRPAPAPKCSFDEESPSSMFDLAWKTIAAHHLKSEALPHLLTQLCQGQLPDGSWPAAPILRVPPHHRTATELHPEFHASDAKRLFVTASCLKALVLAASNYGEAVFTTHQPPSRPQLATVLGQTLEQSARLTGFSDESALAVRHLFADLTVHSLSTGTAWPSRQLSALSAGSPLELSVSVGGEVTPALRYTSEVGKVWLPPFARAQSALEDIKRVAQTLCYGEAWDRLSPAFGHLVAPAMNVPHDLKFWVWSGLDQKLQGPPGLKVYFNLLHHELGAARERLEAALKAVSFPLSPKFINTLNLLDQVGFLHEMGFGLGPKGKVACKLYYELWGWRPKLVQTLLTTLELPFGLEVLCPEITGILRESLAAKSRAGLAFRLDPESGQVSEVTVAAAFPPAMLPARDVHGRVMQWLNSQGWNATSYCCLAEQLLPTHEPKPVKLHTLFTRTVSKQAAWSTLYLRPPLESASSNHLGTVMI